MNISKHGNPNPVSKVSRPYNQNIYRMQNRMDVLDLESRLLVFRLLQLRDSQGSEIKSVKFDNIELKKCAELSSEDLSLLSVDEINRLARKIGYTFTCKVNGWGQLTSKINIEINGKKLGIRCFDHTERPLINHSSREKYEVLCKKAGVDIKELDRAVDAYWECREARIFNEDCIYTSPLNPFLDIKESLRKLLTYIAFHTYNIKKNHRDKDFELETLDGYLDYKNPIDETTWKILDQDNFFDQVWTHLRFSFRADRGMPNGGQVEPNDPSILRWTHKWLDKKGNIVYKGALHIRICKYDTAINDVPFNHLFAQKFKEEIKDVGINQGDKDEYLLKLFLVDCRTKKLPVPIGKEMQVVQKVENPKREEIENPQYQMDWENVSSGVLVYICNSIKAGKASSSDKSDVYINGVGISVKSRRGQPPTIINQTSREKILRVMRAINQPIAPLDMIINRYWEHRFSNNGPEDVSFSRNPQNAFCVDKNGNSNLPILKPLINYFAFRGTGTKDSGSPAKYILSIDSPSDIKSWKYYDEETFVDSLWFKFLYSIRGKGLPKTITDEMLPWVREVAGEKKGTLNIRVGK